MRYESKLREEIKSKEERLSDLRGRIAALESEFRGVEAEANGLRQALQMFLEEVPAEGGTKARSGGKKTASAPAFSRILDEIKRVGAAGMSTDEIYAFADKHRLKIKRNSIRSQLWTYKGNGTLDHDGARYRDAKIVAPAKPEAAGGTSPVKRGAVSDLLSGTSLGSGNAPFRVASRGEQKGEIAAADTVEASAA